jgi:molybdate transport system substrate-binding protein
MRLALLLCATLALAGCGSSGGPDGDAADATVTVFAASSLKGAFTELGKQFEADHDGVEVVFSFAGSSDLVAQIEGGADADVVASADEANMDKLSADDLVGEPLLFASNTLEIAVPPGNPGRVENLDDLTDDSLKLVVCAPEVPCGAAATELAEKSGLTFKPVSEEQSVTDVLNKVISGEADAGLVYVTDVKAAGEEVEGVGVSEAEDVVNYYPVATVADSDEAELAQDFMDLVTGDEGARVLADAGFGKP